MAIEIDFTLDPDDLELGEMEELEELMGKNIQEVFRELSGGASAKLMRGVAFILGRRADPDYTMDDARKVKLGQISPADDDDSETDPGN